MIRRSWVMEDELLGLGRREDHNVTEPTDKRSSTNSLGQRTVLIVDSDLGFVFWLGHILDNSGDSALPARTVPDAALLMMQLDLKVDVLVINISLPGAADFICAMHRRHPQVRVIGLRDDQSGQRNIAGVSITRAKPLHVTAVDKMEWIECVQTVSTDFAARRAAR